MLISVKKVTFVFVIGIIAVVFYLFNYYKSETPVSIVKIGCERLNPTGPNVYLIETSAGKLHLTNREACSVESAAMHHLTSTVTIYNVNGQFNRSNKYIKLLSTIPNVRLLHLNVSQAFHNTPLYDQWYKRGAIRSSWYPTEHMSDALRLAVLWKEGGIYMDTDTIVIRSMQYLQNTVGYEGFGGVNNAVLIFDRNASLPYTAMTQFATQFIGQLWDHQGPKMLDRILRDICNTTSLESVIDKPSQCLGIRIRSGNSFYPFKWPGRPLLVLKDFNPDLSDSFAVHLFESMSKYVVTKMNDDRLINRLFQRNCPLSYQLMKDDGII